MQTEGSVAFGLGAMLYQECTVKRWPHGARESDTYRMMLNGGLPEGRSYRHALRRLLGWRR